MGLPRLLQLITVFRGSAQTVALQRQPDASLSAAMVLGRLPKLLQQSLTCSLPSEARFCAGLVSSKLVIAKNVEVTG